jgi:hypothetical protein
MFNESEASKKADFSVKRPKQSDSTQQQQPQAKAGSVSNVFAVAGIYLYKAYVVIKSKFC